VGWLGDLFMPRTLGCEVCRAKAITISLLEEEIELLTRLLDEEREKLNPKVVESLRFRCMTVESVKVGSLVEKTG
jgi:hypothetical protein